MHTNPLLLSKRGPCPALPKGQLTKAPERIRARSAEGELSDLNKQGERISDKTIKKL